mgnify:CR=1 FL=1
MATIFIVDDDQAIGEMLSLVLENEGFQTVTCLDGLRAVEMFPIVKPDLILLDVMLPGLDGTEVARRIRATSNVPIIMLTAKSDTLDVVAGLEAGADDYVPKPFKVAELLARIHARFRIAKPAAEDGATGGASGGNANVNHLERGSIVIDRLEHTATKDGKGPESYSDGIRAAVHACGRRRRGHQSFQPAQECLGIREFGDTRLVNVHVQRLRAKVEDDPENPQIVQTVRGIGYKFVTPEQ